MCGLDLWKMKPVLILLVSVMVVAGLPAPNGTQVPILEPPEDVTEVDLDVIVGKGKKDFEIGKIGEALSIIDLMECNEGLKQWTLVYVEWE